RERVRAPSHATTTNALKFSHETQRLFGIGQRESNDLRERGRAPSHTTTPCPLQVFPRGKPFPACDWTRQRWMTPGSASAHLRIPLRRTHCRSGTRRNLFEIGQRESNDIKERGSAHSHSTTPCPLQFFLVGIPQPAF